MTAAFTSARTARPTRPRVKALAVLTVGHAVDDVYQGAVPALVPFFVLTYHWSYTQASGLMFAAAVLSSVLQPVFGLLSDRWPMPWLVPAGLGLAGTGIGLAGLGSSYAVIWCAIALSGLGVAAYHPESARLARAASRGDHRAMSWFAVGGNAGFALAPLLVAAVLAAFGDTGTVLLAAPAVACALVTAALLPRLAPKTPDATKAGGAGRHPRQDGRLPDDWAGFAKLTTAVMARSVVMFGLGTFLALFVRQRLDAGAAAGAAALVVFYGVGAIGTLLGGQLANRFSRIRTIRVAYACGVPALAAVALVPGPAVFAMIAVAALTVYVPFSLHTTLGQDYLPNRIGTASGVTLGLAVSAGGLATPALGALADATDLRTTLVVLAAMPAIAFAVALRMREPHQVET
jgi:FSR family fosmidomycin resistance protein-like MFS transporter